MTLWNASEKTLSDVKDILARQGYRVNPCIVSHLFYRELIKTMPANNGMEWFGCVKPVAGGDHYVAIWNVDTEKGPFTGWLVAGCYIDGTDGSVTQFAYTDIEKFLTTIGTEAVNDFFAGLSRKVPAADVPPPAATL